jgi:hypothetical protein
MKKKYKLFYKDNYLFAVGIFLVVSITLLVTLPLIDAGFPRADQLDYYFRLNYLWSPNVFEFLGHLDYNRSVIYWSEGLSDSLLFRPLSYLLLGVLTYLGDGRFWIQQIASILIHLSTLIILYISIFSATKRAIFSAMAVGILAVSPFALELVAWNHLPGYLAFALFVSLFCLLTQQGLRQGNVRKIFTGIILLTVSSFFYELGSALLFIFAFCLLTWRKQEIFPALSQMKSHDFNRLLSVSLLSSIIMPAISLINFSLSFDSFNLPLNESDSTESILVKLLLLLGIWFSQWLIPTAFTLEADTRLIWHISKLNIFSTKSILLIGNSILFLSTIGVAFLRSHRRGRTLSSLLFITMSLLAYGGLIVIGRGNGIEHLLASLSLNVYYLYFFGVFLLCCPGFCLQKTTTVKPGQPHFFSNNEITWNLLTLLLFFYIFLVMPETINLAKSFPGPTIKKEETIFKKSLEKLDEAKILSVIDTAGCNLTIYPWILNEVGKGYKIGEQLTAIDALLYKRTTLTSKTDSPHYIRVCRDICFSDYVNLHQDLLKGFNNGNDGVTKAEYGEWHFYKYGRNERRSVPSECIHFIEE